MWTAGFCLIFCWHIDHVFSFFLTYGRLLQIQENNDWCHVSGPKLFMSYSRLDNALQRESEMDDRGYLCGLCCWYDSKCELLFILLEYMWLRRIFIEEIIIYSSMFPTLFFLGSSRPKLKEKTPRESYWATRPAWLSHTAFGVSSPSSSWSTASASVWTASSTSASPAVATTRRSWAGCVIPVTWPGRKWQIKPAVIQTEAGSEAESWFLSGSKKSIFFLSFFRWWCQEVKEGLFQSVFADWQEPLTPNLNCLTVQCTFFYYIRIYLSLFPLTLPSFSSILFPERLHFAIRRSFIAENHPWNQRFSENRKQSGS